MSTATELIKRTKCIYWKIYLSEHQRSTGNFIAAVVFDKKLTQEKSIAELEAVSLLLAPGKYFITAYESPTSQKCGLCFPIVIPDPLSVIPETTPMSALRKWMYAEEEKEISDILRTISNNTSKRGLKEDLQTIADVCKQSTSLYEAVMRMARMLAYEIKYAD